MERQRKETEEMEIRKKRKEETRKKERKEATNRRVVSSGRAPDCCAGGRGFEPQTGPTLRVLK